MRCPDCSKFVSYDAEVEPEIDVSVADDGTITGTCRIVNNCAECGTELKEASFDISESVDGHDEEACDGNLSVEVENESRVDEMQTKDRKGRTIKNFRYMKHLYGAEATFAVACDKCDFEGEVAWKDTIEASSMDELV